MERAEFLEKFSLPYDHFYKEYLPDAPMEEVEDLFREGFAKSEKKVTVLPHAREFLEFLKSRGAKLFICTSMCANGFADQVVELGMQKYFTETYAGVLDKCELIGEILDTHQMVAEETVFVGDMTHDVEERAEQQVLKVDVDMEPKKGFRQLEDEIEGGVDYYQVSLRIKALALEKPRKLIETLAEDLAEMIKREFLVDSVRVEIEKYILPDTDSVGVEVTR